MADDVNRNAFTDGGINRPEINRILRRQFMEGVSIEVDVEDPLGITTAADLARMRDQVAEQLHREIMGE